MESPPCTTGVTCYMSHFMLSCLWYYHCRLIGEINIFGDFEVLRITLYVQYCRKCFDLIKCVS